MLSIVKGSSNPEKGAQAIVDKIESLIKQLDNYEQANAIGIVVPGLIDQEKGIITAANNLPKLIDYPLKKQLEQDLGKPVILANDVKAAAYGEAISGAGKDDAIVYYISISTGIGGAAVIDQKLLSGFHGFAGEVGNVIVDPHYEAIGIMNAGAAEALGSGTAITRIGKEKLGQQIEHAGTVFDLAKQNQKEAQEIVEQMTDHLSTLLSTIALVIDPSIIILGGGVMKGKDVFLEALDQKFHAKIFDAMRDIRIEEAQLEEPGIVGAAMLAQQSVSH
ncbi:ROK family protein [Dubosiella newyorkensis]|uniref:ROK family protein n=1 Tax=Dubosiella newyorkensis TaxID=1862672 RepID=UPI00339AC207